MAYKTTFIRKCKGCNGDGWYRDDYEGRTVEAGNTYRDQACVSCGGSGAIYYKDYRRKSVSYGEMQKGSGRIKFKVGVTDNVCRYCNGKKSVVWEKDKPGLDYSKYNLSNPPPKVRWTAECEDCFGTGKECIILSDDEYQKYAHHPSSSYSSSTSETTASSSSGSSSQVGDVEGSFYAICFLIVSWLIGTMVKFSFAYLEHSALIRNTTFTHEVLMHLFAIIVGIVATGLWAIGIPAFIVRMFRGKDDMHGGYWLLFCIIAAYMVANLTYYDVSKHYCKLFYHSIRWTF